MHRFFAFMFSTMIVCSSQSANSIDAPPILIDSLPTSLGSIQFPTLALDDGVFRLVVQETLSNSRRLAAFIIDPAVDTFSGSSYLSSGPEDAWLPTLFISGATKALSWNNQTGRRLVFFSGNFPDSEEFVSSLKISSDNATCPRPSFAVAEHFSVITYSSYGVFWPDAPLGSSKSYTYIVDRSVSSSPAFLKLLYTAGTTGVVSRNGVFAVLGSYIDCIRGGLNCHTWIPSARGSLFSGLVETGTASGALPYQFDYHGASFPEGNYLIGTGTNYVGQFDWNSRTIQTRVPKTVAVIGSGCDQNPSLLPIQNGYASLLMDVSTNSASLRLYNLQWENTLFRTILHVGKIREYSRAFALPDKQSLAYVYTTLLPGDSHIGLIYQEVSLDVSTGNGDEEEGQLPVSYELNQNYPNPFNPSTTIEFSIPKSGQVRLTVLNLLGQEVRELVDRPLAAGSHQIEWDGADAQGRTVASGVYFYRLITDHQTESRKMLLLK